MLKSGAIPETLPNKKAKVTAPVCVLAQGALAAGRGEGQPSLPPLLHFSSWAQFCCSPPECCPCPAQLQQSYARVLKQCDATSSLVPHSALFKLRAVLRESLYLSGLSRSTAALKYVIVVLHFCSNVVLMS